jgi:outer membrane murein-binding lipoprotein Lpp
MAQKTKGLVMQVNTKIQSFASTVASLQASVQQIQHDVAANRREIQALSAERVSQEQSRLFTTDYPKHLDEAVFYGASADSSTAIRQQQSTLGRKGGKGARRSTEAAGSSEAFDPFLADYDQTTRSSSTIPMAQPLGSAAFGQTVAPNLPVVVLDMHNKPLSEYATNVVLNNLEHYQRTMCVCTLERDRKYKLTVPMEQLV